MRSDESMGKKYLVFRADYMGEFSQSLCVYVHTHTLTMYIENTFIFYTEYSLSS